MPRMLSFLAAIAFALLGASALAANPEVELDTTAGVIKLELYRTPHRRPSRISCAT